MVEPAITDTTEQNIELEKSLIKAIQDKEVDKAIALVEQGADCNASDVNNDSCLHLAAKNNLPKLVKLLLEKGASLKAKNFDNEKTALVVAVENNSWACVSILIEYCQKKYANSERVKDSVHACRALLRIICNQKLDKSKKLKFVKELLKLPLGEWTAENSEDAYYLAVKNNEREIIELLAKSTLPYQSADDGKTAIMLAADLGRFNIVEIFVEHGKKDETTKASYQYAIEKAIEAGDENSVKTILQANIDINIDACLHHAAEKNLPRFVKFFLEKGASLEAQNAEGETAFVVAVKNSHWDCIPIFINHYQQYCINQYPNNAEPMQTGRALLYALYTKEMDKNKKLKLIEELLKLPLDIWTDKGDNASHMAVKNNELEIVELLAKSALTYEPNNDGKTAIMLAADLGHFNCVKVFVKYGLKDEETKASYQYAFEKAVIAGRGDVVKAILEANIGVNTDVYVTRQDENDNDISEYLLYLAIKSNNPGVVSLLISYGARKVALTIKGTIGQSMLDIAKEKYPECYKAMLGESKGLCFSKKYQQLSEIMVILQAVRTGGNNLSPLSLELLMEIVHNLSDDRENDPISMCKQAEQVLELQSIQAFCKSYKSLTWGRSFFGNSKQKAAETFVKQLEDTYEEDLEKKYSNEKQHKVKIDLISQYLKSNHTSKKVINLLEKNHLLQFTKPVKDSRNLNLPISFRLM